MKLPDELAEVVAEKLTVNLNINAPTEQHLSYLRVCRLATTVYKLYRRAEGYSLIN